MRVIDEGQISLLIDGIERGLSRSELAEFAGVSERTAVSYRRIYEENELGEVPQSCGCGRPVKHRGRCQFRRSAATRNDR